MLRATKKNGRVFGRAGAAVAELAICMPVIALLIFAALEGANMLFLRQALVQSAYECAKTAAKRTESESDGLRLGQEVLAARNIQANIGFNPGNVDNLAPGTPFTVTVSAAGDQRSIVGLGPFNGLTIEAQATMSKE